MESGSVLIHPSAIVSELAEIGGGTRIWNYSLIRGSARVGKDCALGYDVFVDANVEIGDRVKIQNGVHVYRGTIIEADVTIGAGVIFASQRSGQAEAFKPAATRVGRGTTIGAGAVILPGVTIGRYAMVEPGTVVTQNIPEHAQVAGTPARVIGYTCQCGTNLAEIGPGKYQCPKCAMQYRLVQEDASPIISLFMPRQQFRAVQQRFSPVRGLAFSDARS
jgi:acetyltransferase-like isoleucine patch superfamily enzyme